jgi:MATE family multidrug resistance protein
MLSGRKMLPGTNSSPNMETGLAGRLRDVLRLGLPISVTILAEVGLFVIASSLMGWLGVVPLAAHGIAMQLASIAFMVPLGMAQAATVRVGRAFGKR